MKNPFQKRVRRGRKPGKAVAKPRREPRPREAKATPPTTAVALNHEWPTEELPGDVNIVLQKTQRLGAHAYDVLTRASTDEELSAKERYMVMLKAVDTLHSLAKTQADFVPKGSRTPLEGLVNDADKRRIQAAVARATAAKDGTGDAAVGAASDVERGQYPVPENPTTDSSCGSTPQSPTDNEKEPHTLLDTPPVGVVEGAGWADQDEPDEGGEHEEEHRNEIE